VTAWLAAGSAALAVALSRPVAPRAGWAAGGPRAAPVTRVEPDWMRRYRPAWCALAGAGAGLFVQGAAALPAGVVAAVIAWVVIGRSESPRARRVREQVRRELPHVVGLLAATLRSGAAPGDGIALVRDALPGPAADRLAGFAARLALGVDPVQVWTALAGDPELGPLGRALARSQRTGAPVVPAVERLADDLAQRARADVEDRARAVGVKAALPLGLCFLPAFLLVGIVPLVAGLLASLQL
jgi:Flp pilus assembly protein TadB